MAQKYYHSGLSGAPVLNGVAGSLVALLDAVLKDGWGLATATSVVIAGGIATATFASAHAADADITVRVAGATPSSLNGDKIVTAKAGNTISWPTTEPNGTATGTITVKIAPLDFAKPFSGTNKGVYKSTDPAATAFCLRVDDTGTTTARVVGYETMSDVDTGTGAFPTAAQFSGGMYWWKSSAANSTACAWEIVGDERGFYLVTAPYTGATPANGGRNLAWFGDIVSIKSGDAYSCALVAGSTATDASGGHAGLGVSSNNLVSAPAYIARSYTQVGGSLRFARRVLSVNQNTAAGSLLPSSNLVVCLDTYPAAGDASLRLAPVYCVENSDGTDSGRLRGSFPGVYSSLLYIPGGTFGPRDTIVATGEMTGRKLLAIPATAANSALSGLAGCTFIDLKGSWR